MRILLLCFILVTFTALGCATVDRIGEVGGHELYKVTTRDLIAPSSTTILTLNKADNGLTRIEGGVGASMMGQVAGPAATVGAAYFIGKGLEDSGDRTKNTNEAKADSDSVSKADATATVPAAAAPLPVRGGKWWWQYFGR